MKGIILIALLLTRSSWPVAPTDTWKAAAAACGKFPISGLSGFYERAQAWHAGFSARLGEIQRFSRSTCPAYLRHPNDGDALKVFLEEQERLHTRVADFARAGRGLQSFLERNHDGMNDLFAGSGIYFTDFECGAFFWEERNSIYRSLDRLEKEVQEIGRECPAAKLGDDLREIRGRKEKSPKGPEQAGHGPMRRGDSVGGDSKITGFEEFKRKQSLDNINSTK